MFIHILSIIHKILILILFYKLIISFFYKYNFDYKYNYNQCENDKTVKEIHNNYFHLPSLSLQQKQPFSFISIPNTQVNAVSNKNERILKREGSNIFGSQQISYGPKNKSIYIERSLNANIPNIQFEFIGNLYNKEKNMMLKLYGRERIRHVWDYFIIYNNDSIETKIDLSSHKNRLEHLDSIYIEIFETDFILYKNENKYKYYPYIFSG